MSMYTYLKKYAKRKAGVWGRVNHKRDMRAASKAVRRIKWVDYPMEDEPCEELQGYPQIVEEENDVC